MKYDIFTINNELDMLSIRLNLLDPYVDKFVIVEATETFSGSPKPLNYDENKERYKKFHHKIIHHIVKDTPKGFDDPNCNQEYLKMALNSPNVTREHLCWLKEFYQKEHIKRALLDLNDDDICYVSDIDEIWNYNLKIDMEDGKIYRFNIDYCYIEYLNLRTNEDWTYFTGPLVAKWKDLKNECLNHIRSPRDNKNHPRYVYLSNGGWHFNALGGIQKKVQDFTHPYYSIWEMESRKTKTGNFVEEDKLPKFILENKNRLKKYFIDYKPTTSVVVARYKEDINWLKDIHHKTYLYNKGEDEVGIKLDNVGREAHTFLYHIVNNYDDLEDFTIFLQGNPFDHGLKTSNDINNIKIESEFIPLNGLISGCKYYESKGTIPSFCEEHNIDTKHTDIVTFTPGAQFAVSREKIKKHPKEFYEKLLKTLSNNGSNPEEAHVMERLWSYIFNDKF